MDTNGREARSSLACGNGDGAGFYNATVDMLERNAAGERRLRPYLIEDERVHLYGDVIERARAFGAGLMRCGLTPGDRIILLMADGAPFVCSFWGALRVGVIAVPIAGMTNARDWEYVLRDSGARAVVYDRSTEGLLRAVSMPGVIPIAVDPTSVPGARPWDRVEGGLLQGVMTTAEQVAFWLYTSGTTGEPKAALHSHGNLRAAEDGQARQVLRLSADDRILSVPRMFFSYGLGNSVYLPACVGASVVLNRFQAVPRIIQALIDTHRPTVLFAIGSFYSAYLSVRDTNVQSLRLAVSGGVGLGPNDQEAFQSRFGIPLLESFGMTEAMHHVTSMRPGEFCAGSVGAPLEGYDVEVRSPDGMVLEEGARGEIWIKGPTVFKGYWRRDALTARTLVNGWLRTGDWGRLDRGKLFLEGRVSDLLRVDGVVVSPREIEEVLCTHPHVDEAAVVMSAEAPPAIEAYVRVKKPGLLLAEELALVCRERLPAFKLPRSFSIVGEFPKTVTGKIQRNRLKSSKVGAGST